ncbi:MAG: transporter substrate-binding domain-containing protein, partial [Lachnospiraceae bacterium]|nr:transporter substrate-binding domain-containing protein [Lachnospiraceae bacterium]
MKKGLAMTLTAIAALGMATATTALAEDDLLAQIQEEGVMTVGTEGTYAPFTYYDDNDVLVGYDVEIAQAVAEKLGVEAEFVETSWDGIIAGLDAERFDVVFNQVTITDEREEKYNFSIPYTYAHGALIVAADNDEIQTFEDLADYSVAASLTSDWATMAEEYGAEVVSTTEFTESVTLV